MNPYRARVLQAAVLALAVLSVTPAADRAAAQTVIDTSSLLSEMTDLRGLSLYPDPPYTCRQFSSYDRASLSPDQDWFANRDCGQYLRVEEHQGRQEFVMMDAGGPGAVVRIWSANPNGTLRVYLDGAADPVIEEEMTAFLSGESAGFPFPIAHMVSRGWNSYFPIPYAQHCKITSDQGDFYYQINYRTYPAATRVVSFDKETPARLQDKVEVAAHILGHPLEAAGAAVPVPAEGQVPAKHTFYLDLKAGQNGRVVDLTGPKAISHLRMTVSAEDMNAALRGLVLRGRFDGEETIAVPLGDFFGTAPGLNPFESLPMGVTPDGILWCAWWMPLEREAELLLENRSGAPALVKGSVEAVSGVPWTDQSMHFCAKWRISKGIPTRPMQDWTYLALAGKGVFAGDALFVTNPVKTWWGEGDEKIYTDGETFPSHFGTGTEDYYGYAWCNPELFGHAYHNQNRCDGPGNYGHTAVNRLHVIDRIPFEESFRFDMEVWHWAEVQVDYAATSYYYAAPGARLMSPGILARPDDLAIAILPAWAPHKVAGALEGEELEVVSSTGVTEKQDAGEGYSGEAHLWWREAGEGDELVLAFDCDAAGPRRVLAVFTKAPDYGIHRLALNGAAVEGTFDLYKSGRWGPTEEIDLGVFDLVAGRNLLTVTIAGTNPEAAPSYMFGLDYLRLAD